MAEIRSVSTFLIVLIYAFTVANGFGVPFILDEWCGTTTRSTVCMDTVRQDPRTEFKNEPNEVCFILNDKARTTAESTFFKIKDTIAITADSPELKALQTCHDAYDEAIGALRQMNFDTLTDDKWQVMHPILQKAVDGVKKCDAATPKFSAEGKLIGDLATVISDIFNLGMCGNIHC